MGLGKKLGNLFDYMQKRAYLRKAVRLGEVQPTVISKDEYLENKEDCSVPDVDLSIDKSVNEEYEVVEMVISPQKIICPDCGGITYEGLEFCHKCGGEMADFL